MILAICSNPNTLKVFKIIRLVITIVKIVAPIILIITTMIAFVKEVVNKNEDFHEVSGLIFKKIAAAVIIFLVPTVVGIVVRMNGFNPNNYLSCIENATSEKIDELQTEYATKLYNEVKKDYSNAKYNVAKSEINKISDNTLKNKMINELDAIKDEFEYNRSTESKVDKMVEEAMKIANDDSHGYNNTIEGNKLNPDVDCVSFVSFASFKAGLVPESEGIYTGNSILQVLPKYGFVGIPYDEKKLKYGDILKRGNHLAIYVGNNKIVAAHMDYGHPEPGDQDGREVCVVTNFPGWDHIVRYTGK